MTIDLFTTEKGGKNTLVHDLNFGKNKYEARHSVTFKNPSAALINILRETGPVPGDENGRKKTDGGDKKRKRAGAVDMEKLAEGLVKLGEDDLLHVVQMIHDNKSDETYTKNDIERKSRQFFITCILLKPFVNEISNFRVEGEFHVDLYTLPDTLVKMLWDFVAKEARS